MFKKLLTLFLIIGFSFCMAENLELEEEIIQGGIKYNEATARVAAFKNITKKIERKKFKSYLKDPNRKENLEAISKNNYDIDFDRTLCPFYFKKTLISYAVSYYDDPLKVYYYNILGSLVKFEIVEAGAFPKRTFAYSRYGNLLTVNFDIDGEEQFMYEENGKLIAHWEGDKYEGKHSKILKITRGKNPNEEKE